MTTRVELAWALPVRKNFAAGKPVGNYFHYFPTRAEAEKSRAVAIARGKWRGPVEHRPGESFAIGYVM